MILFFHFLCLLARYIVTNISKSISKSKSRSLGECESNSVITTSSAYVLNKQDYVRQPTYENGVLKFFPPVYVQRYETVALILQEPQWKGKIQKVADFGCAELGFFVYLKNITEIKEILEIDIDKEKLEIYSYKAAPLTTDFLYSRATRPLEVYILAGNIADYDDYLNGTDAVIGIELIEHLNEEDFKKMPYNVFDQIKPKLAIFTTPNADFNPLFPDLQNFRHPDHKFEWTRKEFYSWTQEIIRKYPDYTVKFYGIGAGPEGTENLGCCSQMAVFQKSEDVEHFSSSREKSVKIQNYELVKHHSYPVYVDTRTVEQKILHEIQYQVSYINTLPKYYNYEENQCEIPLSLLKDFVAELCSDEEELLNILKNNGIKVKRIKGSWFIIHTESDYGSTDGSLHEDEWLIEEKGQRQQDQQPKLYLSENWDLEEDLHLDDLANFQTARSLDEFEGDSPTRRDHSFKNKLKMQSNTMAKDDTISGSVSCSPIIRHFDSHSHIPSSGRSKNSSERKRSLPKSKIPRKKKVRETEECSSGVMQRTSISCVRTPFGNILKSSSLDSCLENINFYTKQESKLLEDVNRRQFETETTLYLNLIPGGSVPVRKISSYSFSHIKANNSGSSLVNSSFERAMDSGYPFSSPGADSTPEKVDETFTESEMSRSSSSSSDDGLLDDANQIVHDVFVDDVPMENGDLANNNRDGEGNNVERGP